MEARAASFTRCLISISRYAATSMTLTAGSDSSSAENDGSRAIRSAIIPALIDSKSIVSTTAGVGRLDRSIIEKRLMP